MNQVNEWECPTCGGDGELATSHRFRCYTCGGTGKLHCRTTYEAALASEAKSRRHYANLLNASEYRQMGG